MSGNPKGWDFTIPTLQQSVNLKSGGYALQSQQIRWLFEFLSELSPEQQRLFVRFVTGCPRLPMGGLKALTPELTIIRVPLDPSLPPEGIPLPTAMTCTNYLKLPEYGTKELLCSKLLHSMLEGQSGFQLS